MSSWETYLQEHKQQYVEELLDFLRIPSISSLPEHAPDVQRAARWVADRLEAAGLEQVCVMSTGGHPVVYAQWLHAAGKPTVMIYGHFDVQPVDPLELWTQPPFEPYLREGRVYARGASDDKGNMLSPILAVEALLKASEKLPLNVKFFLEGQEEIGSPQLPDFVAAHKDLLACDLVISADGGQWDENQPAMQVGLRGLCALQIDVQAAAHDVHSGTYGGSFQNPIHALVQLLNSMRSPDGKILVEGFYDAVRLLSEEERTQIAAIPYSESDYKQLLGINQTWGEPGFTTYERVWTRPTLEVNGIWGGFQGEGIKTVLPSQAHAKISCRLAVDQEPKRVLELLQAHIERHTPPGVKVSVVPHPSLAGPYMIPLDHPGNQAAKTVLASLYGKEPYWVRMGGTIPVCRMLLDALQAHTVNFAFGLKDENIHAPDEFFRLKSFELGQRGYCMLLEELSQKSL